MRILLLVLFAIAGNSQFALAEQSIPSPPPTAKPIGDAQRGAALAQRWCSSCHAVSGRNTASDAAPSFRWVAEQAAKDPNFVRGFLNRPHPPMPPLNLNQAEIADLNVYFRDLAKH